MNNHSELKALFIFMEFSLFTILGIAIASKSSTQTNPTAQASDKPTAYNWEFNYPFWRKQDNSGMSDVVYAKKELARYFRALAKGNPQLAEKEFNRLVQGTLDERYAVFMNIRKRASHPNLFTFAHDKAFFLPLKTDVENKSYPHICRYEDEIGFLDAHPNSRKEILNDCAATLLSAYDKDKIHQHQIKHIVMVYPHLSEELFQLRYALDDEEVSEQAAEKIFTQITEHQPTVRLLELLYDLSQWESTENFYKKLMKSLEKDTPTNRVQYLWEIIHADYPQLGKTPEQLSHYLENGLKQEVNQPVSMNQFTEEIAEWMARGFRDMNPNKNPLHIEPTGKNGFLMVHGEFSHIFALSKNKQDIDGLDSYEDISKPYTVNRNVLIFPILQFVETLADIMPEREKQNLWRIAVKEMENEYNLKGFPKWSSHTDKRRAILVLKLMDILPMKDIFDVMLKRESLKGKSVHIADTGTIQGNIKAWSKAYDDALSKNTNQKEINLNGLLELNKPL